MKTKSVVRWIAISSKPLLLALPIALLVVAAVPIVHASPPTSVSATFATTVVYGSSISAGGNTIWHNTGTHVISGDIVGTVEWSGTLIVHADGTDNFEARGTFTGSILGSSSGTMSFKFEGQGSGFAFQGNFVQGQGTGGLAGMNIQGTFTGSFTSPTTAVGSVTGKVA